MSKLSREMKSMTIYEYLQQVPKDAPAPAIDQERKRNEAFNAMAIELGCTIAELADFDRQSVIAAYEKFTNTQLNDEGKLKLRKKLLDMKAKLWASN